jgi:hypothetical protein
LYLQEWERQREMGQEGTRSEEGVRVPNTLRLRVRNLI